MNNKWHVWYLYYVKKNPDSFSVLWYCITTLRWDWCIYDRVLHSYLSAFVITAPIAVAMDHYLAVILTPQPLQCTSMFFYFLVEVLMNEYVYVMDCLLRRVFFCIADFCALGADCQFVVQCSNLVIICCS